MPFQYTWELDLSGEGTLMPILYEQSVIGPEPQYLFDLSPHYYLPVVDITVVSGFNGYYDYSFEGTTTPVGVSLYFPNNTEVTWAVGLYSDVPIANIEIYMDKYGNLVTASHGGTGLEFFYFDPLKTTYQDIWVFTSSPKIDSTVVFRSANKYYVTASGKYDGYPFIPMTASGNALLGVVCMANILPSDWSIYHPISIDYYREPTVSGSEGEVILDFTVQPHTERVYGGDTSSSGSHTVNWVWQNTLDNVSGALTLASFVNDPSYYVLQTKTIGDAIGINPNDIRYGLLAWHPLEEHGPYYADRSGNDIHASGTGQMERVMGKHGYASSLSEYPYNHIEFDLPQQENDYMVSFWFKPTKLLTSGTEDYFTLMSADDFYGDHFKDSWNYLTYPQYKGWTLLNPATTCSAGYNSDYLRLKGSTNTDWLGSTWTSSTLFFDIPKSQDWDVEIKFQAAAPLSYGQAAGFIFFNQYSYLKYCSLVWQFDIDIETDLIDSSIPIMTSYTAPSPYIVSANTEYGTTYRSWYAKNGSTSSHWCSSNASHPRWWKIDCGAGSLKVIQGYRMYYAATNYFPRNWTFEGSNNGTSWVVLHTMINQPNPNNNSWTGWFTFSNYHPYRYYRFNITATNGTTYTMISEIEFMVKEIISLPVDGQIVVQTEDLSYTIEEHASLTGTWLFEMQKREDYVWFNYRREDTPGWSSPIYRMDVSLWGEDMRLGVQSRNPAGEAPEILFDYFRFKRGHKPGEVGDPENPGRLLVTYNQVDNSNTVQERNDSRLWVMAGHDGHAYGTARYKWEPDQWYLIQFGLKPDADPTKSNEDFCWWINAKQENGIVVESGTGPSVFVPSGSTFNYFDPESYTSSSGSFVLDEVSHWNRWLTAEEILKMWNKVSQVSWHRTAPYLYGDKNLLTVDTTRSGESTLQTVPHQIEFYWYTEYQSPSVPQVDVQMEKISYRIQKDLRIGAWKMDPKTISILRMSSGWIANNLGCYCLEEVLDPGEVVSASSNKIYSGTSPIYLLDGLDTTLYRTGTAPPTNLMFSYADANTWWKGIRFKSFDNSTYWDDDFPKDIKVYGSDKDSPVRDTNTDWTYEFQIGMSLPAGQLQWSPWVVFPRPILYRHYKLEILNNTNNTTNWISLTEMEVDTEGLTVETIYAKMDVRGDVAVYTRAFDYPTSDASFYAYPRTMAWYEPLMLTTTTGVDSSYKQVMQDSTEPRITYASPQQNSRMIHPEFLWFPQPRLYLDVTEFGNTIDFDRTRVWMKKDLQGRQPYHKSDNFCFYEWEPAELDPPSSPVMFGIGIWADAVSCSGWEVINYWNTETFYVNTGFQSYLTTSGYGSGDYTLYDPDGLSESLVAFERESRNTDAQCFVEGAKNLTISTSGSWWTMGEQSAPFMYSTIPSGLGDWEYTTKVQATFDGDTRGHFVGLQVTRPDDPTKYVQFGVTSSGIVNRCHLNTADYDVVVNPGVPVTDPIWLKISKATISGSLFFYWSTNGSVWNSLPVGEINEDLTPIMTSNNTPAGYSCSASLSEPSNPAYLAFDKNYNTYWMADWGYWYPHWLRFDFPEAKIVYGYKFQSSNTTSYANVPILFRLEGSNDGNNWVIVHNQTSSAAVLVAKSMWYPNRTYFVATNPGFYKYYRLWISTGYHYMNIQLASLQLIGLDELQSDFDMCDLNVGPLVISDREKLYYETKEGIEILPVMTSNTTPAPYEVSASSELYDYHYAWAGSYFRAWHAVDSNILDTMWRSASYPAWFKVKFNEPIALVAMRFYYRDSAAEIPSAFTIYGSNDNVNWTSTYSVVGLYWATTFIEGWTPWCDFGHVEEKYLYWRISLPSPSCSISSVQFRSLEKVVVEIPTRTTGRFAFISIESSEELDFVQWGDGWELLLTGEEPQNSMDNSGVTSYTRLDDNKFRLSWEPVYSLSNGERVFVRVSAYDEPSLKVDYDGYEDDPNVVLFVKGHGIPNNLVDASISGSYDNYQIIDNSVYNRRIYNRLGDKVASGWPENQVTLTRFSDEEVFIGPTSVKFDSEDGSKYSELRTFEDWLDIEHTISSGIVNGDWTVHGWFNFRQIPSYGSILNISDSTNFMRFGIILQTNKITFSRNNVDIGSVSLDSALLTSVWTHLAIIKDASWFIVYVDGVRCMDTFYWPYDNITDQENVAFWWGWRTSSYCNYYVLEQGVKWETDFYSPNSLDEVYTFKTASWEQFDVNINVAQDIEAPVAIPMSPLPNASGVCPASGIVFDILDDYTGVNWDHTVVQIDDITVWSGGNNMTDWYDDRGTLVYEECGRKDGEWEYDLPQGASGTVVVTDGINRQLYPPGTVYSGSGAWGRRFTYYVDGDTEITYFDYHMNITVTGTDNRGYLSQFDDIQPNTFGYEYGFDFITNDNIQMGNFFLDVGESERIDILEAQGRHIWVDLWDTDYPTTDIQEEECYLRFYDGVEDFVCSGTWWTTYTGTVGTASGVLLHRLHYDAGDYYWDGHRTMHWEVHAQNNNPMCHVYNRDEYQLLYGWHLFWLHHDRIPPFEFNKKLPVFVSIKTQDYVPSRYSKSYMIWTAPAGTSEFSVGIKALPLGAGNELEVDLIAHSHYLQYSEDVDVEVTCQDMDGNELLYTWTFRTEDEPEN